MTDPLEQFEASLRQLNPTGLSLPARQRLLERLWQPETVHFTPRRVALYVQAALVAGVIVGVGALLAFQNLTRLHQESGVPSLATPAEKSPSNSVATGPAEPTNLRGFPVLNTSELLNAELDKMMRSRASKRTSSSTATVPTNQAKPTGVTPAVER